MPKQASTNVQKTPKPAPGVKATPRADRKAYVDNSTMPLDLVVVNERASGLREPHADSAVTSEANDHDRAAPSLSMAGSDRPHLSEPEAREPTAREINRQIRAETKAQKLSDRRNAKNAGSAMGVLAKVQKRHPDNPKKQFAAFLSEYAIYAGTGRRRQISEATRDKYGVLFMDVVDDLRECRAAISNIGEIGKAHALVLIRHWTDRGLADNVVQNRISRLRCYLTWIGKDKAIPTHGRLKAWLAENGIKRDFWSKTVAQNSKAWEEKGVDFESVLARVRAICGLTAIQMEVQRAFGLRMAESVHMNPRASDLGDTLRIIYGAKGGKPRDIPLAEARDLESVREQGKVIELSTESSRREMQRDVLERAKLFADRNRRGVLAPDGLTLQQSKRRFYYVLEKAGVTQKELGVTAHGLRHGYMDDLYREITGFAPPVSRDAPHAITQEVIDRDREARKVISLHGGHFREDIAKAYIGSLRLLNKESNNRIREWLARTDGNPVFQAIMRHAGVVQCWVGGSVAQGRKFALGEKLRLHVKFSRPGQLDASLLASLQREVEDLYGMRVDLSEHYMTNGPDDTLEIFIRQNVTA